MAPTSSAPGEGRKNVDIAPTIGHLLGIDVGRVSGKVLREALVQ